MTQATEALTLERERSGTATLFHEDGLHVGTVRMQYRGHYLWFTRHQAGDAGTFELAEDAMRKELAR
jgi:hypothetical protein